MCKYIFYICILKILSVSFAKGQMLCSDERKCWEGLKGQVLEDFEHLVMKVFIGNL